MSIAKYIRRIVFAYQTPQRRLQREVESFLPDFGSVLLDLQFVGAGNVGVVYSAKLAPGWEDRLGVFWKSSRSLPDRVAVKFRRIEPDVERRMEGLRDLAVRIEAEQAAGRPLALCPYVALGRAQGMGEWGESFVQIMPMIEGTSLRRHLRQRVPTSTAMTELIGILRTAEFLEAKGYYSRNLDVDNVIVQPDGSWLRIDFDTALRVEKMPLVRMKRICRLVRFVLKRMGGRSKASRALLARVRATGNAALRDWDNGKGGPNGHRELLLSPSAMIAELEKLR